MYSPCSGCALRHHGMEMGARGVGNSSQRASTIAIGSHVLALDAGDAAGRKHCTPPALGALPQSGDHHEQPWPFARPARLLCAYRRTQIRHHRRFRRCTYILKTTNRRGVARWAISGKHQVPKYAACITESDHWAISLLTRRPTTGFPLWALPEFSGLGIAANLHPIEIGGCSHAQSKGFGSIDKSRFSIPC